MGRWRPLDWAIEDRDVNCEGVAKLLAACPMRELPAEQQAAVAEHVWQCPACQQRWGLGTSSVGSNASTPAVGDLSELGGEPSPPRNLGGFEILDQLGRGGTGTVFRARQRSVDRIVALKVLTSGCAWDGVSVARFTREARAAAAVGHPNIIAVYDVGQDRGWHYIAMEYVEGGSLADNLRRGGRISPSRALELMKQVAVALAETHRIGILHRDVKPSNILLTAAGLAKLADFGLAKRPDVDPSVTAPRSPLGTLMYMAPEILQGKECGPCSDLYGLGATFYHALAGQPPFEAATSGEMAAKQLGSSPAPLGSVAPGTPPPLARIIHRLLDKDPAGRYSSAEDLLEALDAAKLPPTRPASTGLGRLWGAVRRRPKTAIAAILAVLVALAAVLAWLYGQSSVSLFNGKTLAGWQAVSSFPGQGPPGPVQVRNGLIILGPGKSYTGIARVGEFPETNYQVTIEAKRVAGYGDFCSVTFPAGKSRCTLLVGAATHMVRLKRVDGDYLDGSSLPGGFSEGQWYRVTLRVTPSLVEAWINDHRAISLQTVGHQLTATPSYDNVEPFGINSWETTTAIRRIELRRLEPESE